MNKEIKAQWLAALRSGEYQQSLGALKAVGENGEVGYCCLGVLSDLAVKAGLGTWHGGEPDRERIDYLPTDGDPEWDRKRIDYLPIDGDPEWDCHGAYLASDVRQWAGLNDSEGLLSKPVPHPKNPVWHGSLGSLARLNDTGVSFQRIADVIEEQF